MRNTRDTMGQHREAIYNWHHCVKKKKGFPHRFCPKIFSKSIALKTNDLSGIIFFLKNRHEFHDQTLEKISSIIYYR